MAISGPIRLSADSYVWSIQPTTGDLRRKMATRVRVVLTMVLADKIRISDG